MNWEKLASSLLFYEGPQLIIVDGRGFLYDEHSFDICHPEKPFSSSSEPAAAQITLLDVPVYCPR